MSSVGPWESVGGDIKFLRLHQNGYVPRSPSPGTIGCRIGSSRRDRSRSRPAAENRLPEPSRG